MENYIESNTIPSVQRSDLELSDDNFCKKTHTLTNNTKKTHVNENIQLQGIKKKGDTIAGVFIVLEIVPRGSDLQTGENRIKVYQSVIIRTSGAQIRFFLKLLRNEK